jgi:hypothetical protein
MCSAKTTKAKSNTELRVFAAQLRLQVFIERSAAKALRDLGLDHAGADNVALLAEQHQRAAAPRFVQSIELRGHVWQNMDDVQPGFCLFPSDETRTVPTPGLTMTAAMAYSIELMAQVLAANNAECSARAGSFSVETIVLLDEFGQALQRYEQRYPARDDHQDARHQWITEPVAPMQWQSMLDDADALSLRASLGNARERSETSRQLLARALDLRELVAIARSWPLVVL